MTEKKMTEEELTKALEQLQQENKALLDKINRKPTQWERQSLAKKETACP